MNKDMSLYFIYILLMTHTCFTWFVTGTDYHFLYRHSTFPSCCHSKFSSFAQFILHLYYQIKYTSPLATWLHFLDRIHKYTRHKSIGFLICIVLLQQRNNCKYIDEAVKIEIKNHVLSKPLQEFQELKVQLSLPSVF